LQELTTVDGTSIWADDGVLLTSNATRVAAMKMMAYIVSGGESSEPANKQARLESVIPVQAMPQPAAKAAQPAPSPLPWPVPHPLWLSGQLPGTSAAIPTREASSAEDGAAKAREEANPDSWGWPPPPPGEAPGAGHEAAAQAAGADGRRQLRECFFNEKIEA
jgi:hypothetical protein